jgi:hypothetical protein
MAAYDFAVDGGTVGTKSLRGGQIPGGCVVTDVFVMVDTPITGGVGTDTLALQVESAGDLSPAGARNAAPWTAGAASARRHAGGAGATSPPFTTANRPVQLVIAGSALTAGRFRVAVRYLEPLT